MPALTSRIASANAKFGLPEVQVGVLAGAGGATAFMDVEAGVASARAPEGSGDASSR